MVQGGSVMYKDHSDQLHSVKRRRSQEQDGASVVPTSSPLKVNAWNKICSTKKARS